MSLITELQDVIDDVMQDFHNRCEAAKAAGGIPLREIADGRTIPDGWQLDHWTNYYMPPGYQYHNTKQ